MVYEEKKNVFYIVPKAGYLTYLDEELLDQAKPMEGDKSLKLARRGLNLSRFAKEIKNGE